VSVVTPVYNGAMYLEECIRSVLRQTYRDWEYVIVDNQSTDGTAAIAERYAVIDRRIRVLRPPEFISVYGNHNRALRAINPHSRYAKFVHADDWLYPECLERMVALAERHSSVGVVSTFRLEGSVVEHSGLLPYDEEVMPGNEVSRRASFRSALGLWFAHFIALSLRPHPRPQELLRRDRLARRYRRRLPGTQMLGPRVRAPGSHLH
jgi:glycosyltransferase involved in cell wall biosynthesis